MATFNVPTRDQVDAKAQGIFDNLKKQLGMVPNLYATIGSAGNILESYLGFSHTAEKSSFRNREVQAIYLAVSEVNGCSYCLSAHTTLGKMNGFSEEETFDLRAGTSSDTKLRTLTQLARSFVETQGRPDAALVDAFFGLGYDQKAFVEFVALINAKQFANYIHNSMDFAIDFPVAKPLPELATV